MARRSSLQPNSLPKMEVVPFQCCPEMCTTMNLTGAFSLVALQQVWDTHSKNIIPGTVITALVAAIPASILQRPIIAMPALYPRAAATYNREMYKLEKERFEKIDEAETTLHAAIVESLSPGTERTINTATPSGIASLSAVGLVHNSSPHQHYKISTL
jgi:hypothetical protein